MTIIEVPPSVRPFVEKIRRAQLLCHELVSGCTAVERDRREIRTKPVIEVRDGEREILSGNEIPEECIAQREQKIREQTLELHRIESQCEAAVTEALQATEGCAPFLRQLVPSPTDFGAELREVLQDLQSRVLQILGADSNGELVTAFRRDLYERLWPKTRRLANALAIEAVPDPRDSDAGLPSFIRGLTALPDRTINPRPNALDNLIGVVAALRSVEATAPAPRTAEEFAKYREHLERLKRTLPPEVLRENLTRPLRVREQAQHAMHWLVPIVATALAALGIDCTPLCRWEEKLGAPSQLDQQEKVRECDDLLAWLRSRRAIVLGSREGATTKAVVAASEAETRTVAPDAAGGPLGSVSRDNLSSCERDTIDALGTRTMVGEELAKAAGYAFNSTFKSMLAALRRRGILDNVAPGYLLRPEYHFLLARDTDQDNGPDKRPD